MPSWYTPIPAGGQHHIQQVMQEQGIECGALTSFMTSSYDYMQVEDRPETGNVHVSPDEKVWWRCPHEL
jgi:hypothetical protein